MVNTHESPDILWPEVTNSVFINCVVGFIRQDGWYDESCSIDFSLTADQETEQPIELLLEIVIIFFSFSYKIG